MEIGGCDIIVKAKPDDKNKIIELIRTFWKDLYIDEEKNELFVYENKSFWDNWTKYGCTLENDKSMIYIIFEEEHATFVIDNNKINAKIVKYIEQNLV